jgi:hypothetical protein
MDADAVFEMDADFSHDPVDIPRLLADLVHSQVHFVAYDFCSRSQICGLFWLSIGTEEIILTKH